MTNPGVSLNKIYCTIIENVSFGILPSNQVNAILKDGRIFSHFIEKYLAELHPSLNWISGCKPYDLTDLDDPNIKYDQKTFTKNGCKFMPSNMIGTGRTFNQAEFIEKSKILTYIIVDNVDFPEITYKFVNGVVLATEYPNGCIPFKHRKKFFNTT
jgi:hypothetical protein